MPMWLGGQRFDTPSDFSPRPNPPPMQMGGYSPRYESPDMDRYREHIRSMPQQEDFQPGKMDRLGAILSGVGESVRSGPAAGFEASRRQLRAPYDEAMYDWGTGANQYSQLAQMEQDEAQYRMQYNNPLDVYDAETRRLTSTTGANRLNFDVATGNRAYDRGVAVDDRNFARGVTESDRDYYERVREFNQTYDRGVKEFDQTFDRDVIVSDRDYDFLNRSSEDDMEVARGNLEVARGNLKRQQDRDAWEKEVDSRDFSERVREFNNKIQAERWRNRRQSDNYQERTGVMRDRNQGGLAPNQQFYQRAMELEDAIANHPEWSNFVNEDGFVQSPESLFGFGPRQETLDAFQEFLDYLGRSDRDGSIEGIGPQGSNRLQVDEPKPGFSTGFSPSGFYYNWKRG